MSRRLFAKDPELFEPLLFIGSSRSILPRSLPSVDILRLSLPLSLPSATKRFIRETRDEKVLQPFTGDAPRRESAAKASGER